MYLLLHLFISEIKLHSQKIHFNFSTFKLQHMWLHILNWCFPLNHNTYLYVRGTQFVIHHILLLLPHWPGIHIMFIKYSNVKLSKHAVNYKSRRYPLLTTSAPVLFIFHLLVILHIYMAMLHISHLWR